MKKILIISMCLISFIILLFCLKEQNTPTLSKTDCDEFGICKEGLIGVIENETFIINKDTCLKYNKQWREDLNACYMR